MSNLGFASATRGTRIVGFAGTADARGWAQGEIRPSVGGVSVVQLMADIPANKPSYLSAVSERERCP